MYHRIWREPVQLELPFPPHELSNVIDLSKRIRNVLDREFIGFTSRGPIQLELPFPPPFQPKVLDFIACALKAARAA